MTCWAAKWGGGLDLLTALGPFSLKSPPRHSARRGCDRVDRTLIKAWASVKSFVPKDGSDAPLSGDGASSSGRNAERDFHGEKRANDMHFSTTDPDARLYRKGAGKEANSVTWVI
jgi:hypothetical protein